MEENASLAIAHDRLDRGAAASGTGGPGPASRSLCSWSSFGMGACSAACSIRRRRLPQRVARLVALYRSPTSRLRRAPFADADLTASRPVEQTDERPRLEQHQHRRYIETLLFLAALALCAAALSATRSALVHTSATPTVSPTVLAETTGL
jgi:hypothetical protein